MTTRPGLPKGVYAASLTPLHKDYTVNYRMLADHCKWLLAQGCNGLVLHGTTSEGNSFSVAERKRITAEVIERQIDPVKIIVGTGCCSMIDTIELTKHALDFGVSGILMLPPFYYKQVSEVGLIAYFDEVIQRVNDDRLRIYLYHFPQLSGVGFSVEFTAKLTREFPGIIVGMKDSGGEWEHMKQLCDNIPGFQLFAGSERFLLDALKAGGVGCITATTNIIASLAANVYQNSLSGNANEMQSHLSLARQAFGKLSFVSSLKQITAHFTGNPEWLHMRPPNAPVAHKKILDIIEKLDELGFHNPFI